MDLVVAEAELGIGLIFTNVVEEAAFGIDSGCDGADWGVLWTGGKLEVVAVGTIDVFANVDVADEFFGPVLLLLKSFTHFYKGLKQHVHIFCFYFVKRRGSYDFWLFRNSDLLGFSDILSNFVLESKSGVAPIDFVNFDEYLFSSGAGILFFQKSIYVDNVAILCLRLLPLEVIRQH